MGGSEVGCRVILFACTNVLMKEGGNPKLAVKKRLKTSYNKKVIKINRRLEGEMGDIVVSLIVIVVVGVAVAAIFVISGKKKSEREKAIQQLAMKNGWQYEKVHQTHEKGFILRGEDWTLEAIASTNDTPSQAGSSEVSFANTWHTNRVNSPGGMVLIGPKVPSVNLGGLGDMLLQKALQMMIGEEADQAVGLKEVFVGRTSFRDRFSVWATDQENAEKLLTYELENELLNWKMKEIPVIKFSAGGVEIITRQDRMDTPEKVQAVVDLGRGVLAV